MEKISQIHNITQIEFMSFFSCELFLLIGIVINLIMFLFFSRKFNIKRLSDLTTFGIFATSSLASIGIYLKNKLTFGDFNFSLFNEKLILNNDVFLFNFLILTFFACFVLCTYKLTRRANFMGTIINSSLLLAALSCAFLIKTQGGILTFLFLDLISFFIYKFASNMRIRKYETYSIDFVLMSLTSTLLFYFFHLLSLLIKEDLQLIIIQVCMVCALLLKAGLFPIYNYSLNRHTKSNLAYSILLFGFLPYMGVLAFAKYVQNINISNEVFFATLCVFLLAIMLISSINFFKTKNLVSLIANSAYFNCSFYLISILFMQNINFCIRSLFISLFTIFALCSLLAILKVNLKQEKLTISLFKGLFLKNRLFCILFSILILAIINIIPSAILINNFKLLSGIYTFNEIGFWVVATFLFANMLMLINALKIIKNCYSCKNIFKTNYKLIKRTTSNYVVPIIVILLLIILIFL